MNILWLLMIGLILQRQKRGSSVASGMSLTLSNVPHRKVMEHPTSETPTGIVPYGRDALDTLLYPITDDHIVGPIITPLGVTCDCDWSNHLYVSVDGFVILGELVEKVLQPSTANGLMGNNRVIAPLWTDMIHEQELSHMWYHTYYRYQLGHTYFPALLDRLYRRAGGSLLLPIQAVVVTWENMVPAYASETSSESVTFQLVLLTDAVNTYAIFNYIQTSLLSSMNSATQQATMGWRCSDTVFYENHFSMSGIYAEVFLSSITGTRGTWTFKLGDCPSTNISYSNLCVWMRQDHHEVRCPCLLSLAELDDRYSLTNDKNCYGMVYYKGSRSEDALCCYGSGSSLLNEARNKKWDSEVRQLRGLAVSAPPDETKTPDVTTTVASTSTLHTTSVTSASDTFLTLTVTALSTTTTSTATETTFTAMSTASETTTTATSTAAETTTTAKSTTAETTTTVPTTNAETTTTAISTAAETTTTAMSTAAETTTTSTSTTTDTTTSTSTTTEITTTEAITMQTSTYSEATTTETSTTTDTSTTATSTTAEATTTATSTTAEATTAATSTTAEATTTATSATAEATTTATSTSAEVTTTATSTTAEPTTTATSTTAEATTTATSTTTEAATTATSTTAEATTTATSTTAEATTTATSTSAEAATTATSTTAEATTTATSTTTEAATTATSTTAEATTTATSTTAEATTTATSTSAEAATTATSTSAEVTTTATSTSAEAATTATSTTAEVTATATSTTAEATTTATSTTAEATTTATSTTAEAATTATSTSAEAATTATSTTAEATTTAMVTTSANLISTSTIVTTTAAKTSPSSKATSTTSASITSTITPSTVTATTTAANPTPTEKATSTTSTSVTSAATPTAKVTTSTAASTTAIATPSPVLTTTFAITTFAKPTETITTTAATPSTVTATTEPKPEPTTTLTSTTFAVTTAAKPQTTGKSTTTTEAPTHTVTTSTVAATTAEMATGKGPTTTTGTLTTGDIVLTTMSEPGTTLSHKLTVQPHATTQSFQHVSTVPSPSISASTTTVSSTTATPETTTPSTPYIAFGASAGDTLLAFSSDDDIVGPITAPIGFACECTWSTTIYVSVDGFVILGTIWETATPSPPDIPTANLPSNAALIAPLWTDMRLLNGTTFVWYQVYYRYLSVGSSFPTALDALYQSITGTTDTPVEALVVTWQDLLPVDAADTSSEFMSLQLVLLTDAVKTYTVYSYISTSWLSSRSSVRPAAMAWQCSDVTYYNNYLSLSAEIYDAVFLSTNIVAVKSIAAAPKNYEGGISTVSSVSETKGTTSRWSFRMDYCPDTYTNFANLCYLWVYTEESDASLVNLPKTLDNATASCPCSLTEVEQDSRFRVTRNSNCYGTVFATDGVNGYRTCCYDASSGALLTSLPSAGYQSLYHPNYAPALHQTEDTQMFVWCCQNAGLCDMFAGRRPVDDCLSTISSSVCTTYGEPHILTVDGNVYTYNSLGEYTLLQILDTSGTKVFDLQGRAEKFRSGTDETINATVFTSLAGEDKVSGGYFSTEINLNRDGFIIYTDTFATAVDGTLDYYLGQDLRYDGVVITRLSNTSMRVLLRNGIGADIALRSGILDVALLIPAEFRQGYSSSGLLGNNDGDPTNDFQLPNGTILSNSISEQEIFQFGETWRLDASSSILHYRAGFTLADYVDPSFVPLFLSDFSTVQREQAEAFCGASASFGCVFDFLVTADPAIANATQRFEGIADFMVAIANNQAPEVSITQRQIYAEVGVSVEIVVQATDADDQTVTLYLMGLTTTLVTREGTGAVNLTYSWTPVDNSPVNISVYAVDSVGIASSRQDLEVLLCSGCVNGLCDYPSTLTGALFTQVSCKCDTGWTGTDCTVDKDGCENGPCGQSGVCGDLSPTQEAARGMAFSCSCEAGYQIIVGYDRCQDTNECMVGTSGCSQGCVNILGAYSCVCDLCYWLIQGKCVDIDECVLGISNCQHVCTNTEGGYQCSCVGGYFLNPNNYTCTIKARQAQLCSQHGCEQGCEEAADGTVNCICNLGYMLAADGQTCDDIDECVELQTCVHVCTNTAGSYECGCYNGYKLTANRITCEACAIGTWGVDCQSNCSQCQNLQACDPTHGCVCRQGWEGSGCDININECGASIDPCTDQLMVCTDTPGSYVCECGSGYELMANGTCQNIDECGPTGVNDCPVDISVCIDQTPGYACLCLDGYFGDGHNCIDIDECASRRSFCDHVCEDRVASHNCNCFKGYLLNDDRRTCTMNADPCSEEIPNAEVCLRQGAHGCIKENGFPECFCRLGYNMAASGMCEDIDECQTVHVCSEICINIDGGYQCGCNHGSQLSENMISCQACNLTRSWGPNCENQCNCGAGSLYCDSGLGCICSVGWTGSHCDTDINECEGRACLGNQTCVNTPGSYTCSCQSGYEISGAGCVDIDECSIGTDSCNQRCINQPGSYTCACRFGYDMAPGSTTTCINIDECVLGSHDCHHICTDVDGRFLCSCHPGFVLNANRKTCDRDPSFDPCANVTHQCEYGCQLEQDKPICFCENEYQLNPVDKHTCDVVYKALSVTVMLSLEYRTEYDSHGSQDYKNLVSDLRYSLLALYADVENVSDIYVEQVFVTCTAELTHRDYFAGNNNSTCPLILLGKNQRRMSEFSFFAYKQDKPPFEVQHSIVFSVTNISNTEVVDVASDLKAHRDNNRSILVVTRTCYFVNEPKISQPGREEKDPVTCVLCTKLSDCILVDVAGDRYSCAEPRDEATSVDIWMVVKKMFLSLYADMLSPEYMQLAASVRQTLRSLFQGVEGFAGLGDIFFRAAGYQNRSDSMVIQTYVKFNHTVQPEDVARVAENLYALRHSRCLQIDALCVALLGEILLLQQPAVCWTCGPHELCLDTLDDRGQILYTCVPVAVSTHAMIATTEKTDLLLGLGLGFPLVLVFIVMCVAVLWFCSKRRHHSFSVASTLTPSTLISATSSTDNYGLNAHR